LIFSSCEKLKEGKQMLKVFWVEDESIVREGLKNNIPWQEYGYQFMGEASEGLFQKTVR